MNIMNLVNLNPRNLITVKDKKMEFRKDFMNPVPLKIELLLLMKKFMVFKKDFMNLVKFNAKFHIKMVK